MWNVQRARIGTNGRSTHCPKCKSERAHRSRRKGIFEKSLGRLFGLLPYRCDACDERYFGYRFHGDPLVTPHTMPSESSHPSKG